MTGRIQRRMETVNAKVSGGPHAASGEGGGDFSECWDGDRGCPGWADDPVRGQTGRPTITL